MPWFDTVGMTALVCEQMVTQLHVYQESIKKNLKGADYTNQANGFATRTDNFVAIPYITSASILFGYFLFNYRNVYMCRFMCLYCVNVRILFVSCLTITSTAGNFSP